jgi:hypothetical protein
MSEFLSGLHHVSRYSHITLGFIGLVLFWVPIIAFKGGRVHRFSGKVFALIALWVGSTGVLGSVWAVTDPISFTTSLGHEVSEKSAPYVAERFRFFFGFLLFLSLATVSGVVLGVGCAWTKARHEGLRNVWVVGSLGATLCSAVALAVFGAWNLWLGWRGQHLLPSDGVNKYWVHVILGVIGIVGLWTDLQYVLKPALGRRAWFYKHLECMLSTGIAFYTAFLVFGSSRFYGMLGIELKGAWNLVPWLLPTAMGLPLITMWGNRWRRKFGDIEPRPAVQLQEPTHA